MSVQFIGMIGHRLSSETLDASGPIFDKAYISRFAQVHEDAGFDRLLVGYWSDQPDGFLVTALAGLSPRASTFCWPTGLDSLPRPSPPASWRPLSTCSTVAWRCT